MSAYGAVISLKNTLTHIYFYSRPRQIIEVVYEELQSWERILQRLDESSKSKSRKKVNALDGRIKDAIWNFEDSLESLVSHQITLQSGEGERDVLLFSIDLRSLQDDVHSFIQTLKDTKEEYIYEVDNMPQDEDEDEDESACSISSSTNSSGIFVETKSKMIGLSDQFELSKTILLRCDEYWESISGYALVGMAGVGKTTLARELYEDPQITSRFDCRLWIRVGRKSSSRLINQLEVSQSILAELKGDEKCLIVVDDVWEQTQELSSLFTSIKRLKNSIILILLTTRDRNVLDKIDTITFDYPKVVRILNEDESKELLCHKVFGENIICPHQLDKAATKIANKCEGLPLTIVTVADLLSKSHNRDDPDFWEDVAQERNSVFIDAYNQISKVLFPSYDYLPQRFKMLFLYMAVFPRDHEIPPSKIINMLKAEGWFLDPDKNFYPEVSITHCLAELCMSHNILLFKPTGTRWFHSDGDLGSFKTCRLHSAWRQLCRGEARKNKFYHVLNRLGDASEEEAIIQGQRCLCLENNLLFGIKEFCNSVRCSNCASTTRSLLFFGPYHQYPTPIDAIGFKLLRELNALQLRFYTFPMQILKLIQLKYLALTCNGDLPSTISKLFNLKVLIIHPHMSITKCCDTAPSYIPIEIWDMKVLEHIEILGKSFRPPPNDHDDVDVDVDEVHDDDDDDDVDVDEVDDDDDEVVVVANSLEKVSTVVGVNAGSICTITKRIPNVRKLAVQMELTPYDDDAGHSSDIMLSCFAHISILEGLKTLKCSIINPVLLKYRNVGPSCSLMFPRRLKKLHLSGMGFPWEYMDVIGCLPCLQVLKLRSYAFRGSKWETQGGSFLSLSYLLIEDSDLVEWKPSSGSFPDLNYLSLKHCYKLKELHWPSDCGFGKIELVDCNPLGVSCAKKIQGEQGISVSASDHYSA